MLGLNVILVLRLTVRDGPMTFSSLADFSRAGRPRHHLPTSSKLFYCPGT
jgi:hypothetical protein